MEEAVKKYCRRMLRALMEHPHAWVFNTPVDPQLLRIPDYFEIISKPMNLGTVKSKLDNSLYASAGAFVGDVRLTFANAMTYNPPSNEIHAMAKTMSEVFETRLRRLQAKMMKRRLRHLQAKQMNQDFQTKLKLSDEENIGQGF